MSFQPAQDVYLQPTTRSEESLDEQCHILFVGTGVQCQLLFTRSDRHTYIYPHLEAGHRRVSTVIFPHCNATEKECQRTMSSSSAAASALPVSGIYSDVTPGLSLEMS